MTATPIRLLLLEDNPGDARLVQAALVDHAPGEFAITTAERLADALVRIGAEPFDAVLCDLGLPDSAGLATARAIAARVPALPLVVLTGSHDQSLGRMAIQHGAQDYLVKGESGGALIARTLRYAIERKRLEIGLRTANEALEHRVAERTAELERANVSLRYSEARFRSLAEMSSDFYWETDAEHRLKAREAAIDKRSSVAGFDQGRQIGKRRWEIAHVLPDEAGWRVHRAALDAHLPFRNFELSRIGIDGIVRHLSISGDPVFDATGAFEGYRGVGTDITERKAAEAKIRRLGQLYAALSQCNHAIVHSATEQELFLEVCRAAVESGGMQMAWIGVVNTDTLRIRPAGSFGKGTAFLIDVESSADADSPYGRGPAGIAVRENRPYWCQDYPNDPLTAPWHKHAASAGWAASAALPLQRNGVVVGVFFLYSAMANAFDESARNLLVEMATDISFALGNFDRESQRRQANAALAESEHRFRALIENASDITAVVGQDGVISYASPSVKSIAGYDPDELLGSNMLQVIHSDDFEAATGTLSESINTPDKVHRVELRVRMKDGSWRDFDVLARNQLGQAAIAGIIVNMRDITERKQAEKEIQELSRFPSENPNPVLRIARNATISYANQSSAPILTTWRREVGQNVPDGWQKNIALILETDISKELEIECEGRIFACILAPIHAEGYVNIYGTDITERKRSERALLRANRALRTLSAGNEALIHAQDEQVLLRDVCALMVKVGGFPLAWIAYAVYGDANGLRLAAHAGFTDDEIDAVTAGWTDSEYRPTADAIRTGQPQIVQDLMADPRFASWRKYAQSHGCAALMALPLRDGSATFGALAICAAENDAFDTEEVSLLTELADDLSFGIRTLRIRTERDNLLQQQARDTEKLKNSLIATIGAMALTVEKRDPYTAGHQTRVAELSLAIGRRLGLSEDHIEGLRLGATIHDIGKIYVPAEILNRPGKLSAPEFEIIKSHPQVGYDIVKDVAFPWPVANMILQHHERLDGSGYPGRLKDGEIILEARIIAVADIVEAMSSHRPYRAGLGLDAALAQIRKEAGTTLDAQVVDACESLFRQQGFTFSKP